MLRVLALFALASCALLAQPLTFEAASVKPNRSGSNSAHTHSSGANLEMTNVALADCIRQAYGLKPEQMSGPGWLESERVDIIAKAASPQKDAEMMQMLQSLLVERFKLASHFEDRQLPGYLLLVDKKLRIQPVQGSAGSTESHNGHFTATEVTLAQFSRFLSRIVGAPVIDQTNAEGSYTFSFTFTREIIADADVKLATDPPAVPTIFDAVRELGLKLELRKLPTQVLIVDRMERSPVEN